jgi:hypothetical protein
LKRPIFPIPWIAKCPFLYALIIVTVVVAPGYWRQEMTIKAVKDGRTEARVAGCRQYNEQVDVDNAKEIVRVADLNTGLAQQNDNMKIALVASLESLRDPNVSPEQKARADGLIAGYAAVVNERLANPPKLQPVLETYRDCSPAGLDAYYSTTTISTSGPTPATTTTTIS